MENPVKCVACNRIVESPSKIPFCSLHMKAYSNLVTGYGNWRNAYGSLSKKEFLERLRRNDSTGKWVREVIQAILSHEDLMQSFLNDSSSLDKRD